MIDPYHLVSIPHDFLCLKNVELLTLDKLFLAFVKEIGIGEMLCSIPLYKNRLF